MSKYEIEIRRATGTTYRLLELKVFEDWSEARRFMQRWNLDNRDERNYLAGPYPPIGEVIGKFENKQPEFTFVDKDDRPHAWAEQPDGSVIGYMCKTDYECHLGEDYDGAVVYSSERGLRSHRSCVEHCGIVSVKVFFHELIDAGKDYSE